MKELDDEIMRNKKRIDELYSELTKEFVRMYDVTSTWEALTAITEGHFERLFSTYSSAVARQYALLQARAMLEGA